MLDSIFKAHVVLGTLPELNPWIEVELYRKFNNGHLPMDPLHTPKNPANGGSGIKISVIGARVLRIGK